jgi:anaerobic selenocysteine-containing dehydrogenase
VAHAHGVWTAAAVQSLNALVGSVGVTGGVRWLGSRGAGRASAPPAERYWPEALAAAPPRLLLLWGANPVFGTPAAVGLRATLGRSESIVAFTPFLDDSAVLADLVLPDLTYLERWDLVEPEVTAGARTISIQQPAVAALYEARDRADVLLVVVAGLGGEAASAVREPDYASFLKAEVGRLGVVGKGAPAAADAGAFWESLVRSGAWTGPAPATDPVAIDLAFVARETPRPNDPAAAAEYPLWLQPFESGPLGDGRTANVPWLQELPDPMTSIVWGSWVELNPRTAAELGIADGEIVRVESSAGALELPALLTPAARPDVAAMPFGQGHRAYGRYASGRGANPWEIVVPRFVRGTAAVAWGATRVRVVRTGGSGRLLRLGFDQAGSAARSER